MQTISSSGFEDVRYLLEALGFEEKRSKGSHDSFRDSQGRKITVPKKGGQKVKGVYVQQIVELLVWKNGAMKTLNQKNKQIEKQPLEYYLNLQYPVILYPDPEGGYVAQIKDLPGCLTQGETLDEAIANINEARELWIETAYEAGDEIPLPSSDDTYSGKLLLRMPKSLHRRLAEAADRENVSLNQYIVSVLSRG